MKYSIDGYSAENSSRREFKGGVSRKRPRRSYLLRFLLAVAIVTVSQFFLSGCMVTRADRLALRDSRTGILTGAEPRELGPANADAVVLLVHGYVGCGNNFATLPERLAEKGFRVKVILLPGHGTSPKDLKTFATKAEAAKRAEAKAGPAPAKVDPAAKTILPEDLLLGAVKDSIAELKRNHKRVYVAGHSMGGALSTIAVSEMGADGLVLVAPYFGVTHRWWYGLHVEQWSRLMSPVVPWVYKGKVFMQVNNRAVADKIVSYVWVPTESAVMLARIGEHAREIAVLEKIVCPVQLLHSVNDDAASPDRAKEALAKMRPKYQESIWYDRSNHHLLWDYDGDDATSQIVRFIGRLEAEHSGEK
jgi:carboxylesterase